MLLAILGLGLAGGSAAGAAEDTRRLDSGSWISTDRVREGENLSPFENTTDVAFVFDLDVRF